MVTVPVRVVVFGFDAKLSCTVPLPDPLAPEDTEIQDAFDEAFHAQPEVLLTVTAPVPTVFEVDSDVALNV